MSTPTTWIAIDRVGPLADADLADAAGPGAHLAQHHPRLARPGTGALIVPWFSAASREAVRFFSGSTSGTSADEQQRLDQPVVVVEPLEPAGQLGLGRGAGAVVLDADLVRLLQERPELVW